MSGFRSAQAAAAAGAGLRQFLFARWLDRARGRDDTLTETRFVVTGRVTGRRHGATDFPFEAKQARGWHGACIGLPQAT